MILQAEPLRVIELLAQVALDRAADMWTQSVEDRQASHVLTPADTLDTEFSPIEREPFASHHACDNGRVWYLRAGNGDVIGVPAVPTL
jgi:hypothetical protein